MKVLQVRAGSNQSQMNQAETEVCYSVKITIEASVPR